MVVAVGRVAVVDIDASFAAIAKQSEEIVDAFLKDVAAHVRDEAKTTAAFIDKTGNLRRSIGMRKSKFIRGGYIVKASGRNRAEGATGGKGFHAHLVEFGHSKVLWGRRTGGRVAPRPFMRPALEKGKAYAASKLSGMKG